MLDRALSELRRLGILIAAAASAHVYGQANVARGKTVFEQCSACHALSRESTEAGPSLVGVAGRTAGRLQDFRYSRQLARSGLVWNAANLDRFLTSPHDLIPGTRMAFSGIESAEDRAALIEFLGTLK